MKVLFYFLIDFRAAVWEVWVFSASWSFGCDLFIFLSEGLCDCSLALIQKCLHWCRLGWVYTYSFVCALDGTFQSETYVWKTLFNHFYNDILSVFPLSGTSYVHIGWSTTNGVQKQVWESSCLLLTQTLKRTENM